MRGYFRRLAKSSFKENKGGKTLFYPWGILGKGYIIQDKKQEEAIRGFVIKYYVVLLIPFFLIGVTIGWIFGIILVPFAVLVWMIKVRTFTKGLIPTDIKLTFTENLKMQFGLFKHTPRNH